MIIFKDGQVSRIDLQHYAPGYPRLSLYEPCALQVQHHLMDGRRCDLEIPPHVGFGGGPAVNLRIGVDESEVLTLLRREFIFAAGVTRGVCLLHQASQLYGGPDEHTIPR